MPLYAIDGVSPTLPAGFAYVADTAVLIGKVILEEEASVWFGVVARGDNEPITIGARANVQENAVLHTDPGYPLTIGAGVTVGHRAMLHGCIIGEGSLIGMGATVLNGARIGRHCLIGAGALITEGKQIPDHSLVVGSPGKVIRQLDAEAVAGLARSAETYVRRARHFAAALTRVG